MQRTVAIAMFAIAVSAAPALAQDVRPSDRYEVCLAEDGLDQRFDDLCELVDELHRRIAHARGQTRNLASLHAALSAPLIAIANDRDVVAYRDAIEASERAQEIYNPRRFPSLWAGLQLNIGASLLRLGEVEEAVAALNAGIARLDRVAQPQLYASLQERLGHAYLAQSGREDRDLLARALTAFETSREIVSRDTSLAERRRRLEASIADVQRLLSTATEPSVN